MTATAEVKTNRNWWRIGRLSAAAALLCVPAIAMRFTGEVVWTASDFVVMGTLLAALLGAYEFLASRAPGTAYRAASVAATLGLFLLIWMNMAVGVIGTENNDANMMFIAVIAIGVGGACLARFRPAGMKRALYAAALAQLAVGVIAVAGGLGTEDPNWPRDVIFLTGFYTGLWAVAGTLFGLSGDRR
ncbi:hypothetical protein [Sphingomonas sp.]|uniref:hypothetical protein n=1 Tax=Sphingomonas sp. TaxID=28214 RepID=UPI002ED7D7B6